LFGLVQNEGETTERENPEPTTSSQARTYGDGNVELPDELQNALKCLVQEAQRQDLFQRRLEVLGARRRRFYERGIQHIYEDVTSGVFVQASPGASVPDPSGQGELQCGNFVNDYNIFGRALQIIIAKLTENPVGVDFQPDSGESTVDEQAAAAAEAYKLLYDRRNDIKDLLTAIVRMMGTDGRTISWTRTVLSAPEWGTDEQGQPRKVQTTSVYGVLEAKVPIMARKMADWPYCIITEDPHILIAKEKYPAFADKIQDQGDVGISDTQFERLARIGALQGQTASFQITDSYEFYVEEHFVFFRPSMFLDKSLDVEYTDMDQPERMGQHPITGEPRAWTLRDALKEAFPDGCVCTFVGEQYTGSQNVCMDDQLAVDFPYAGDGMSRPSIMDPAVVIQDDFNDDMNNYHEAKVFGWPSTWINAEYSELAAVNSQDAAPYCFRALKSRPKSDQSMEDMFWREPDPNIPESFMRHTEYLATQLLQFILAIPSAVQGAGMPDQKTASGYNAALTQAMGQLGVIWGAVQRLMAKIYRQAALLAAKDDQEQKTLMIPSPKGPVQLRMADLGKGHFLAHPDVDSGYPESTQQKRATLGMVLDMALKDPVILQGLMSSPDNWDFIFRTFGIPEIVIPEARVRRKQLAEIEILVNESPLPADPAAIEAAAAQHAQQMMVAHAQGLPTPPPFDPASVPQRSSVPVMPEDYHDWEAEECKEKLSDWPWVQQQNQEWAEVTQSQGLPAQGEAPGITNIRLHLREHQQYVAKQAQAQMAMQAAAQPAPAPKGAPGKPQPKLEPQGAPAPQ
jgi:hypothetical protein